MAIFSNTTVAKATFAERLNSVKGMFQTAHNQASALNDECRKRLKQSSLRLSLLMLR